MTLYNYERSIEIAQADYPFYALIMAAMRKADSSNIEKLKEMWPETYNELKARYNAPGGELSKELEERYNPQFEPMEVQ